MSSFKGPPAAFHVLGVESHIWIVPVHPNPHHLELFGHKGLVFHGKLLTFVNEIFDAYAPFNFLLTFKSQESFHLVFNGQAVGVPSGLSADVESGHGFVTEETVFYCFVPGSSQVNPATAVWWAV